MTDNGLEFTNKLLQDLCNSLQITIKHGSPYHPQTTGEIERCNKTFIRKLKCLSNFGEVDWGSLIKQTINACNVSFSRPIGCSLYEYVYEKQPFFDIDKKFGIEIKNLGVKIKQDEIKKRIEQYQSEYETKREIKNKFKIGDLVWYFNPVRKGLKLETSWERKGVIVEENKRSYVVEDTNGRRIQANENYLRRVE